MATTPLAYNPSLSSIDGTDQVGTLAVGITQQDYSLSPGGVSWWNGPEESTGYVIAVPVSGNTQPTPLSLTWDPNFAGTGIVLSSGNTIATVGQTQSSVLGTRLITSPNKVMYSIRVNQLVAGEIGFGLQDMDLNSYVGGSDGKSIGFSSGGDYLYAGTQQDSGLPTWGSVNDVVDVALDLNTGIWWIRVNGGNWNGTRNEDPSSGTGSVNSAGLNNLYAAVTPTPVNIQGRVTLLSQPVYSVPSGFTFLGETNASVGFYRSADLTENSFVELTNTVFGQNFANGTDCKIWLNDNGYWTSFVPAPITPTPTPTGTAAVTPTVTPTNTQTPTTTITPTPTSSSAAFVVTGGTGTIVPYTELTYLNAFTSQSGVTTTDAFNTNNGCWQLYYSHSAVTISNGSNIGLNSNAAGSNTWSWSVAISNSNNTIGNWGSVSAITTTGSFSYTAGGFNVSTLTQNVTIPANRYFLIMNNGGPFYRTVKTLASNRTAQIGGSNYVTVCNKVALGNWPTGGTTVIPSQFGGAGTGYTFYTGASHVHSVVFG
jgi:hypothetical protein